MSENNVTESVKSFYGSYSFPGIRPPDRDGLLFLRKFTDCVKSLSGQKQELRVLDAGCGTGNTTISLGKHFPDIQYTGLDISEASLKIAEEKAAKAGLNNVVFRKQNLMEKITDNDGFDIVLCLGVLHHTELMSRVLLNLKLVMKKESILFLWIYGRHGRYFHSLNMKLLRMLLDVKPDKKHETGIAREFAMNALKGKILQDLAVSYFDKDSEIKEQREVFNSPVWIADQFLNPHETLLDLNDLLIMTENSGFSLISLPGFKTDVSEMLGSEELASRFRLLSQKDRLLAADLLLKPERYFAILKITGDE
jgi:2-polyprenyl-3-methyl-5-hydroxy-6-metoxy-1,4-benzoquinol methylase